MNRVVEGFASVRLMAAENFSLHPKSILCTRARAGIHTHTRTRCFARVNLLVYVGRLAEISFHAGSPKKGLTLTIFRGAGFNFLDGPPIKPITRG